MSLGQNTKERWHWICFGFHVLIQLAPVISVIIEPGVWPEDLFSLYRRCDLKNFRSRLTLDPNAKQPQYILFDASDEVAFNPGEVYCGLAVDGTIVFDDLETSVGTTKCLQFMSKAGPGRKTLKKASGTKKESEYLLQVNDRITGQPLYTFIVTANPGRGKPKYELNLDRNYSHPGLRGDVKLEVREDTEHAEVPVRMTYKSWEGEITYEELQGIDVYEWNATNKILTKQTFLALKGTTEEYIALGVVQDKTTADVLFQCLVDDGVVLDGFFTSEDKSNVLSFSRNGEDFPGFSNEMIYLNIFSGYPCHLFWKLSCTLIKDHPFNVPNDEPFSYVFTTDATSLIVTENFYFTVSSAFEVFKYNWLDEVRIENLGGNVYGVKMIPHPIVYYMHTVGIFGEITLVKPYIKSHYVGRSPNTVCKTLGVPDERLEYYRDNIFRIGGFGSRNSTVDVEYLTHARMYGGTVDVYFTQIKQDTSRQLQFVDKNDRVLSVYSRLLNYLVWRSIVRIPPEGIKSDTFKIQARSIPNEYYDNQFTNKPDNYVFKLSVHDSEKNKSEDECEIVFIGKKLRSDTFFVMKLIEQHKNSEALMKSERKKWRMNSEIPFRSVSEEASTEG